MPSDNTADDGRITWRVQYASVEQDQEYQRVNPYAEQAAAIVNQYMEQFITNTPTPEPASYYMSEYNEPEENQNMQVTNLFNRQGPLTAIARYFNRSYSFFEPDDDNADTYRGRLLEQVRDPERQLLFDQAVTSPTNYTTLTPLRLHERQRFYNLYRQYISAARIAEASNAFNVDVAITRTATEQIYMMDLRSEVEEGEPILHTTTLSIRPFIIADGDLLRLWFFIRDSRGRTMTMAADNNLLVLRRQFMGTTLGDQRNTWTFSPAAAVHEATRDLNSQLLNYLKDKTAGNFLTRQTSFLSPETPESIGQPIWKLSTGLLRVISNIAMASIAYGLLFTPTPHRPLRQLVEWIHAQQEERGVRNIARLGSGTMSDSLPQNLPRYMNSYNCSSCGIFANLRRRVVIAFRGTQMDPNNHDERIPRWSYAASVVLCLNCINHELIRCASCDRLTRPHLSDPPTSEHPSRCQRCAYNHVPSVDILNYSYRPEFRFHTLERDEPCFSPQTAPEELFMGIEIEMEVNASQYSISRARREWLAELPLGINGPEDFFYVKGDSSLRDGFELCTHPFTPDWAFEHFPFDYFDEAVDEGKFEAVPSRAGQHIHVARASFTKPHLARFLGLHGSTSHFIQQVGGRTGNSYAPWPPELSDTLKDKRWVEETSAVATHLGRAAVNLQNGTTIELRYPQGVARGSMIRKNIEWVDALYSFTKTLTEDQYELVEDPGYLLFWITSHPERYSNLQSYIDLIVPRPKQFDIREESA